MKTVARKIANSIRAANERHAERTGPGRFRATVTRWANQSNFALDVHGSDLDLDEQDVTLTQHVIAYDNATGIQVGDNLVLLEVDTGDYLAIAVASDTEEEG